jgi:hypothetical protein
VSKRVASSPGPEAAIDELLSDGLGDADRPAEAGQPGARLVLQRALGEEVAMFIGCARYERAWRREALVMGPAAAGADRRRFVNKILPDVRTVVRTWPLETLIIGAYVRGLSDRDIESIQASEMRKAPFYCRLHLSPVCYVEWYGP